MWTEHSMLRKKQQYGSDSDISTGGFITNRQGMYINANFLKQITYHLNENLLWNLAAPHWTALVDYAVDSTVATVHENTTASKGCNM